MTGYYRNLLALVVGSVFLTFALTGENANAQTKTAAQKTQTSAPKPTPKKIPANAKINPSPKTNPPKTNPPKSTPTKKTSVSVSAEPKPKAAPKKQLIVNAAAARVRRENNLQSETLQTADVGTIFNVIGEDADWSQIEIAKDKEGWISKTITENFSVANRIKTYNAIADKYLASKKTDFKSAAEVFYFLKKAGDETGNAELEFKKFKMLAAVLKSIPFGKMDENPYKNFTDKNEEDIVYSDPSGEWYVNSTKLWELHAKHKNKPLGEQIAWQAAQTTLAGECEGYINCYIYKMRITDGEYLNFYPSGKYSREALRNITNFLEPINQDSAQKAVYDGPSDISDRADFNKNLAELRTIISKTPYIEKQKTIAQINRIAEAFK